MENFKLYVEQKMLNIKLFLTCAGRFSFCVIFFSFINIISSFIFVTLFVETSVRNFIGLKKFLVFLFLSVCVSRCSSRRNYSICLKLHTTIFALCGIRYIDFGVNCPNSACTGIHKNI